MKKKAKLNKTMRAAEHPFNRRIENIDHLKYVKSLPCSICKAGFYTHDKVIQAHHLLKPSDGKRGMSLKSGDDQVIPLCMFHHTQLHTKFGAEPAFFAHYGLKADFGQKYAKELWFRSIAIAENDDDLPF